VDDYGKVAALEVLSAEELPLFHYKPSISWLRIGGKGCTMRCPFCNTYRFSQTGAVRSVPMMPDEIVADAQEKQARGVAFGVNEPAPMHEFVFDTFREARAAGLDTHLATNAMWSPDALMELAPLVSAATVGLKGFDSAFFAETLGADRFTIETNIQLLLAQDVHVEISWLLIPGLTDSPEQVRSLLDCLAEMDRWPPIMVLPYYPDFTWKDPREATLGDLKEFHRILKDYRGGVYELHEESPAMNTCCTQCGRPLVRRGLAGLIITRYPTGKPKDECPQCGAKVPYVVDD